MAAATKLFQFRHKSLPITTTTHHSPTSLHLFSSSSTNHDPDSNPSSNPIPSSPPPQSQSQHSSFLDGIKASLRQQEQQRNSQSQVPRRPFSFSYSHPNQSTRPSKAVSAEEIRKNLSEFRRRTAAPPPPSYDSGSISAQPGLPPQISFQKLYERKVASKGGEEGLTESSANMTSFNFIRESLREIKPSPMDKRSDRSPMYLSKSKQSLNMRTTDSISKPFPNVIGGSHNLPLSVFGPEIKANEDDGSSDGSSDGRMRTEFLKMYDHKELGEKLRLLRPENKGGKKDWFSLEELSERLVKLREMEKRESKSRYIAGVAFYDLREGLYSLQEAKDDKAKKNTLQRLDILGNLGRTPGYMSSPPKEVLVEKYFHPDNMSASEKLKLELSKVRDEFKMSDSDCGSARVQVAQLTTKIKHLSTSLHKKDKHSRKGLEAMVQRRKKLLKYMRRTDWDSYCFVLSKLGLRDNPNYKN